MNNKLRLGTKEELPAFKPVKKLLNRDNRVEEKSKRNSHSKHFRNQDGKLEIEINAQPVHFYNKETKEYEEIDNTLVVDQNKFKLSRNAFKLEFNQDLSLSSLMKLSHQSKDIELIYKGKKEGSVLLPFLKSKGRTTKVDNSSSIVYSNIHKGIDLEYSILNNRVKENIIIKERQADIPLNLS